MSTDYPRDMVGYGAKSPNPQWPDDALIAVQFVVNYEEGGENNILHGDAASEAFLSLHRLFEERRIPATVFGVASALEKNQPVVDAMLASGWEIATHGLKWIDYKDFTPEQEREHLDQAVKLHQQITGSSPAGVYIGRTSVNSQDIAMEKGGFVYCSDTYADELPYWRETVHGPQLMVPYTLDANDMRFATPQGFNSGDQFYSYLKDSFDMLYTEGHAGSPKMMSVGLHCRLAGRPGRAQAVARFMDYCLTHKRVWIASRLDIANHWIDQFSPSANP